MCHFTHCYYSVLLNSAMNGTLQWYDYIYHIVQLLLLFPKLFITPKRNS